MQKTNKIKFLALYVAGTLLLVSCGNNDNNDSILDTQVANTIDADNLPSLHILPTMSDEDGNPNDNKASYTLTANKNVPVTIESPTGAWKTPMWRYNNNPLPLVIRTNRGTQMTLKLNNNLDADSTIHWHGFKIPAIMDGGPDQPVKPGKSKVYSFTMNQPAAPLWFHPHPDMQTGKQVYMGLAGVFLLEDEISKQLEAQNALPSSDKDVVLVVQDRRFTSAVNGEKTLLYKNKAMDSDGMLGSTILVNGSVMPKLEVATGQYRLRLCNLSNAKTYDFAFSDNRKFKVIATDGGLLNEPVEMNHIMLGAAERVEIVVDFGKDTIGSKVVMVSKAFEGDSMSNMGEMNNDDNAQMAMEANGMGAIIMRFDVTKESTESINLYTSLPVHAEIATRLNPDNASNTQNTRKFVLSTYNGDMGMTEMNDDQSNNDMNNTDMEDNSTSSMSDMSMIFAINDKIFDPKRVDEFINAGTTEIWEITNTSPMAHPFHAHAIQWQILDRNGVKAKGTDLGWKDTFLIQEDETVRIIGRFEAVNVGDYMYHCHILEHEDAGMMGYFRVGETGILGPQ